MREALKNLTKDMWTIPNALTMLRLVLVPVFIALYMNGQPIPALAAFCVASITDFFDGYLARRLNQITNFGKLFDPLADKLMVLSALICHALKGVFPWAAVIITLAKELILVAGGAWLLKRKVVVSSNMYGKVATAVFIAALILGFFHAYFPAPWHVDVWLVWVSVALSLAALVSYAVRAWPQLFPKNGGQPEA